MISGIDPSAQQFLNDLARIQARSEKAQRQISSGLKVSRPSDAPDQIGALLQLHAEIARNTQIEANLGRVKTEVDIAERALGSALQVVERAMVLGAQGTGMQQTAETRASMAQEVQGIREHLLAISQTTVEGHYVFSVDLASATREIEEPGGSRFVIGRTAQDLFDRRNADGIASENVFAALDSLRLALSTNDADALQTVLGQLRTAYDYLNAQTSFYGAVQNRVAAAMADGAKATVQLKAELSQKQDADLSEAILELTQSQTQQQAALAVRAKMPRTSLFDFLG